MSGRLDGKVAIITGGLSGIGLASVEVFIEEGARVAVADLHDGAGAALEARFPGRLVFVKTDVTDEGAVESLVERTIARFERLDVMFNNAGAGGDYSPLVDLKASSLDQAHALLVRAVFAGHKYAARQFIRQRSGGSIITTGSAASAEGGWSGAAYTIGKTAILGIMRAAVAELSPLGIRTNVLMPGAILTPILATAMGVPKPRAEEFLEFVAERFATFHPIGRMGLPRDVAEAALFLASDASTFISGAAIPVDGGATAVTLGGFGPDLLRATQEFLA